VSMEILVTDL